MTGEAPYSAREPTPPDKEERKYATDKLSEVRRIALGLAGLGASLILATTLRQLPAERRTCALAIGIVQLLVCVVGSVPIPRNVNTAQIDSHLRRTLRWRYAILVLGAVLLFVGLVLLL